MKKPRVLDAYLKEYQRKLKEARANKKRNKDKLFTLTETSIQTILQNNIKIKYPEISFKVDKSISTNSYYIMFFYGDRYVTTRISDHESRVGALGIVVTPDTTKKEVIQVLEQRVIDLKYKYKAHLFNKFKEIEKERI